MYSGTISVRRRSIKSQPSRLKLTPSLPMLPTTDFGPRLLHKTGIVPKFRFDGTQTCQPVRPAGLQPAETESKFVRGLTREVAEHRSKTCVAHRPKVCVP